MKKYFNKAVKQYLRYRYKRIKRMRSQPFETQKKVLLSLLKRGKSSEVGKKFNFSTIKSAKEFADILPLTSYEDIKDDITRMMAGETDVLWRGKVKWFSKSSGTTSERSKYLPVSKESLYNNNVAASWDTMAIVYHEDPDCEVFWKKTLLMGGSIAPWPKNKEAMVGDVSAILIDRMPAVGRPFYSPDFKTALLDDWSVKLKKMTEICTKDDVVMLGGVPTWTIVLFQQMMEKTGASNMKEIWPNVKYYIHGGVGFDPYEEQFKALIHDPEFRYFEVYNASEGYFAIQDRGYDKGMLLLLDNDVFYEFIPLDELSKDKPQSLLLNEVELDKHYAIVISTSAGLWRYLLGDTVIFTDLAPFRIKVSGRTKHFINVFGEEVMVGDTDLALARTIEKIPAQISQYTVAPIFMETGSKGGHHWLIEFEDHPSNVEEFQSLLDKNLQEINSDYAAKRFKDIALQELKLTIVPEGTFMKWLDSKGKIGGQNKVPRLYNTRKYIDELLG